MTDRVADEDFEDAGQLPVSPSGTAGDGEVNVLGTAHVSHESVEEVEATIAQRQPDVVAVELDEGRYRQMKGEGPEDLDPSDLLGGNTVFQFLAYWMLSYVQTRLGDRFDITPGADMLAAVETAEDNGLGVALVDRDIQTTMQRFWTRLTPLEKLKLVANLVLAVGPPATVGLALGAAMGLFLGFAVVMAGGGFLGLAGADITAAVGGPTLTAVGGLAVGGALGLGLWLLFDRELGQVLATLSAPNTTATRLLAGVWIGGLAGLLVAISGGLSLGPAAIGSDRLQSIGGGVVRSGIGLVGGGTAGGLLGFAAGSAVGAVIETDTEDIEEFDIEELTDADVVTAMMEEFRRFSPGGAEALIDERDAFIAHRLVALREAGYSVVAVVGAGHRKGIEGYLERPASLPPMSELTGRTSGRRFSAYRLFGYLFTLGFLVFFVLLAIATYTGVEGTSSELLLQLFAAWFLVNGIVAFVLAKLAGAHWQSASVGGGIAWLTSVNPLLAPGWFAGYVELRYLDVNVGDIATLNEIISDEEAPIRQIWTELRSVPLFRLIMIVALTNVVSFVGSIVFATVLLPYLFAEANIDGASGVARLMLQGAQNSIDLIVGAFV